MSDEPLVLCRLEGASAWLTLNRPGKRNALDDALLVELRAALDGAFTDAAIRSIVITG